MLYCTSYVSLLWCFKCWLRALTCDPMPFIVVAKHSRGARCNSLCTAATAAVLRYFGRVLLLACGGPSVPLKVVVSLPCCSSRVCRFWRCERIVGCSVRTNEIIGHGCAVSSFFFRCMMDGPLVACGILSLPVCHRRCHRCANTASLCGVVVARCVVVPVQAQLRGAELTQLVRVFRTRWDVA
ncbi:unnamed protein product [Ectocarpus sp. 8 AP-2014]